MTATSLGEAAAFVRDEIKTANPDVRVTLEPDEINPPCVWIQLDHREHKFLAGDGYIAEWNVHCIAPRVGSQRALDIIDGLFAAVSTVFDPDGEDGREEGIEITVGSGNPLPATRFKVRTKVT